MTTWQTRVVAVLLTCGWGGPCFGQEIPADRLQAIYEQVKTPYKIGVVIPAPTGKKVDCPNVFRDGDQWYMVYVQLEDEPPGYTTQLAHSRDLIHWEPLGTVLPRGGPDAWDRANAGGGLALTSPVWGDHRLQRFEGKAWMTYLGGRDYGYEKPPLPIGLACTDDPTRPTAWHKHPQPILTIHDGDVRPGESGTLFKSFVLQDPDRRLGARFVMYYNARPPRGDETILMAVSDDLRTWRRYGSEPVIAHERPADLPHGVISGDPQIVRIDDLWVMFYFGAFWQPKAFDTFAVSEDLVHWTPWTGPHLIEPSEPYDQTFAHKPWLIFHDGVVYHFYCAVGDQGRVIALAASKPLAELQP